MKVTTNIKKSDLIFFNLYLLPKLKSTYLSLVIYVALIFAFLLWLHGIPKDARDWSVLIFGSICGGFVGQIIGIIFTLFSILLMSKEKNGILGVHIYEISPEGLFEKTIANEGLSKWSGIVEIKEAGNYLLFGISSYLFHIVPKRSFPKNEEYEKFVSFSKHEWAKAHNQVGK